MSKLTRHEEITMHSYDSSAREWMYSHMTPKFWDDNFDYFYELFPEGRVLEVGCGAGRDAQELIKHGYDYTGIDISGNLLELAQENNPEGRFQKMSLYDMNFEQPFDGFWCAAVLIHVPKKRIAEALQAIKHSVIPKAIGFIAMKEGEGEKMEVKDYLKNLDFLFAYWQNQEFREVLRKNDFEVLRQGLIPVSEKTRWLTYHVQTR